MSEIQITNIFDIHTNGPWVCKIYDNHLNKFKQLGELFMYDEHQFFDKDGNGPWAKDTLLDIQEVVEMYNKDELKCYFTPFVKEYQIYQSK